MKQVLHKAESRGFINLGWLDSRHSFSFGQYYNPECMHFGALRVLNDDVVAAGMGFNTHAHEHMEIVSIPLYGDLEHRDNLGNVSIIRAGDVQVMSAGTGIHHSEFNYNNDKEVRFLQIWIFPKTRNTAPSYQQKSFLATQWQDHIQQVVSPKEMASGIGINQDAWISRCTASPGFSVKYSLHTEQNGVYLFLLEGKLIVEGITLAQRDGLGIWEANEVKIQADSKAEFLIIEVPM